MEQARESSDEWRFDQPPVGGHRGRGQARDGVDPVPLISLVGWVCSSGAQKEGKNSTTVWSVYILEAPFSARPESWLVVARGASAPLRLVGHLGWVHRQEARAVGRPRERMMPLREALTPRRDRAGLARKTRSAKGGVRIRYIIAVKTSWSGRTGETSLSHGCFVPVSTLCHKCVSVMSHGLSPRPSVFDLWVSGRPPAASEGVGPPSLKTKTSWKTAKISLRERHCAPLTSCGDVCRHQY